MKSKFLLIPLLLVAAGGAYAAGMFAGLPIVGGAAYCSSFQNGVCVNTVPAGPTAFTGNELIPADTQIAGGSPPQTAYVKVTAFGQGAVVVDTTPSTDTIPANTPFYFLNGTQSSAFTVTMPAAPAQQDIQHVTCTAATVGVLTVAANTGQTLSNNPNAACVAGVGYTWVYSGTNWYRI